MVRTSVEPLEGNKVKLSVEVDEAEFDKAIDAAFRKIARDVRIPGFRPGKAPRRLLEARIGVDAAREEAIRDSLPEYYLRALRESDVDAIAPPDIDITAGRESGPIAFDAVVEIRPQVTVPGYSALAVVVPTPAVTDEEIDTQVDRLREQFGELVAVTRPARDSDHVTIDVGGTRHGEPVEGLSAEDFLYEVGRGTINAELDDHLRGAKPGDILKFTAPVPGQDEPVTFQVLVKEVKEKHLPEVTDEWAGEASEFETVAELREDIRTRVGQVKRMRVAMLVPEKTIDALVELVDEEPPEPMVGAEMERRLHDLAHRLEAQGATMAQYLEATGTSEDDLIAELRATATRSIKADLALRAVADAEAVEVDDEEVEAEIARIAERLGQKPAAVRKQLDRADQLPAVRSDLRKSKALSWVVERVEIVDEDGQPVDRAQLNMAGDVQPDPPESADSRESESPVSESAESESAESESAESEMPA